MNIRDLKYLIAVAETEHFGKAADRCFVSQPTLSTQIKKLEEELGVQLFERTNKSVMATPIGEMLVAEARRILQQIEHMKQLAENSKDPMAGKFKLGIIPTLGPYLLPYLLQSVQQQLPKLELIIVENKTSVILQQLREGDLDAAILALPVDTHNLVAKTLFYEPFYVLLPKAHPLATKKSLSMKVLQDQMLLLLEEGHCLREQALEACRFTGAYSKEFSATSLETLRQLVGLGAGITFIPALAVDSTVHDKNVIIRPISDKPPAREVGILWRGSSAREECCQLIAKIIQKNVQSCDALLKDKNIFPLENQLG